MSLFVSQHFSACLTEKLFSFTAEVSVATFLLYWAGCWSAWCVDMQKCTAQQRPLLPFILWGGREKKNVNKISFLSSWVTLARVKHHDDDKGGFCALQMHPNVAYTWAQWIVRGHTGKLGCRCPDECKQQKKLTSGEKSEPAQMLCAQQERAGGIWCIVRNENIKKFHNTQQQQLGPIAFICNLSAIWYFDTLPFNLTDVRRASREKEKKVQEWQSGKQIWAICKPDNANRRTRYVYSYKYLSMLSGSWVGESAMRVSAWCSSNDDAGKKTCDSFFIRQFQIELWSIFGVLIVRRDPNPPPKMH